MAGKKKKRVEEDPEESASASEWDEEGGEEEEEEEEEHPAKRSKGKLAEMEAMMGRAFEGALRRVKEGKASKGAQPPRKPEKGLFEQVAEWFGVDE